MPDPVDCEVGTFGLWSTCSASCGGGLQTRTREVLQAPMYGGKNCPTLTETRECGKAPCPVHCVVSDWSAWSACSTSCGTGTIERTRTILTHPGHGGQQCPALTETEACINAPCAPGPDMPPVAVPAPGALAILVVGLIMMRVALRLVRRR